MRKCQRNYYSTKITWKPIVSECIVFCCDGKQPCWTTKNAVELQLVASRFNSKFFKKFRRKFSQGIYYSNLLGVIIVGPVCRTFFNLLKHELHVPQMLCRFTCSFKGIEIICMFDIDIDIYWYLKNPEKFRTFGYRTCHKSVYEATM
jgi:hypothetical protein